jgi:archaellum component FlaG (FlaF/FlaG flagellin family)
MNTATLKTTEFVLTFITAAGAVAASVSGVLPERYAAIAASVSVAAYAMSRGLSKVFQVPTPPEPAAIVLPPALAAALKEVVKATPTETEPTA